MHWLSFPASGRIADPAHGESEFALCPHFDRYLIVRAADPLGTDFGGRTGVLKSQVKHFQRIWITGLFFDHIKSLIHHLAGSFLLAAPHDVIDKLLQFLRIVDKVRSNYISVFYFASHG